jgi:hypothetical protein
MSKYNVFISYSRLDLAWATRLHASLKGRGLQVYFDIDSLRDGDGWETQLEQGLKHADRLVCRWSQKAYDSPWVHRELAQFRAKAQAVAGEGKVLIVQLDDRANAYGGTQQILDPALKAAYADAQQPISNADWGRIIDRLDRSVRDTGATLQVPVALLTLTSAEAQTLSAGQRYKMQQDLGIDSQALTTRYGSDRLDWRPFGPAKTILDTLEESLTDLNRWLAPQSIAWQLPDDAFWTDNNVVRAFAARMASSRLGAVIVDPVALLMPEMLGRLGFFSRCLQCENVAFIALPPEPASTQEGRFHKWLSDYASNTFDGYLEPPRLEDPVPHARYGVSLGLGDVGQVRRLLQRSVGDHLRRGSRDGGPRNPITSFGAP